MAIPTDQRKTLIEEFKVHDKDSGSPEVQVALLTAEIKELTEHMKRHRKDYHSQRGLLAKVGRRRKLLRYLDKNEHDRYRKLIDRLGLRH